MLPALLSACGSDPQKPGAMVDSAAPVEVELGADPGDAADAGEALAGVVRDGVAGEAALAGGVTAEGRSGDPVLWNDRARFVIQGVRPGNGIVHTSGNILDVDVLRDSTALGRDTIEDVFVSFGLSRLFDASSVTVVSAGGPGQDAVVQAMGRDVVWEYLEGMFERTTPLIPDLHLQITNTYTLPPDAWSLQIQTELRNTSPVAVEFTVADGIFASAEDLVPWAPGTGLEGPASGLVPATWFVGRTGEASVGLARDSGDYTVGALSSLASDLGIFFAEVPKISLGPGETVVLNRFLTVAPDVATGEAQRRRRLGESLGTVSGTVAEADGTGIAGVRVHMVDGDGGVGALALTDAGGAFTADLPPGDWTAWAVADADSDQVQVPVGSGRIGPYASIPVNARQISVLDGTEPADPLPWATGRAPSGLAPFTVAAGADTALDVTLGPASGLTVHIVDEDGNPLPGIIDLRWAGEGRPASAVPEALHDALGVQTSGRQAWGWTATGTMDLDVPPGTFTMDVGHSWRHTRAQVDDVVVMPGERAELTVTLETVVSRDGWLALDPHLHAAPSFDGALPMEDRLVTCAAAGVELPVLTDHDAMTDYAPLATALGLDGRMKVIPGLEVTTLMRGHFNVYPLPPQPLTEPNGGAIRWWDVPATTQELFDRIHTAAGTSARVQVNHPRSPGMFAFARYVPATGEVGNADMWSWDFDFFELLNGGVDGLEDLREDWFSMLDMGVVRVPVGVSDSHYRYIPCGLGRTDVMVQTEAPGAVTEDVLRAALDAGHVVVASGTTLRATVDGALPGDTVTGSDGTLSWAVSAPDWIEPGVLRIYHNGLVVHEEVLDGPPVDGVWGTGDWSLASAGDGWVVVEVEGSVSMGSTWRGALPYAITNAFFIDEDGDGWTAPGMRVSAMRRSIRPSRFSQD